MNKICRICRKTKPIEQFPSAGRGKRRRVCGKCYYIHNTKVHCERIRQWYIELKKGLSCLHCGIKDFRVLEFHHRPGTKKLFNVADKANQAGGRETILAEIAKCDVLCANCHRIETYGPVTQG